MAIIVVQYFIHICNIVHNNIKRIYVPIVLNKPRNYYINLILKSGFT